MSELNPLKYGIEVKCSTCQRPKRPERLKRSNLFEADGEGGKLKKAKADNEKYLAINKCTHHGFMSVSIDDEDGGVRITPTKCCGSWVVLQRWRITESMVRDFLQWIRLTEDQPK